MNSTISFIGTGAMGGAIIRSLCAKYDASNVTITNRTYEKAKKLAEETGCNCVKTNKEALKAKYIFIGVKPQFLADVFAEIKDDIPSDSVVISMAAGVKIEKLETFAKARYVRIMPNVAAQVGESMTAVCCNDNITKEELSDVMEILNTSGKSEIVPERLMDCVTGVSGSGPAYVFMFIEALADAAVRCGMPRSQAYTYAAQTVYGSAAMVLETKKHPAELKDMVCSPAGTTIEAVAALEKNGFRNAVIEAVTASFEKSIKLGK